MRPPWARCPPACRSRYGVWNETWEELLLTRGPERQGLCDQAVQHMCHVQDGNGIGFTSLRSYWCRERYTKLLVPWVTVRRVERQAQQSHNLCNETCRMTGLLVNSTGLAVCTCPQQRAAVRCPWRSITAYTAQSNYRTGHLFDHRNVPLRRAQVVLATRQDGPSGSSAAGEDVTKRYSVGNSTHSPGT